MSGNLDLTGPAQLDALFPDGPALRRSTQAFFALLALAALIASFGLIQDSVAAIIGAMIVAPLGGAIMALAGALVTGRMRWQGIAVLEVLIGGLMVVSIGFIVGWILPNPLLLTPSLEARTAPGLADLGVALAAGAAGAYVAVRRTGADALPGVAIAVSLVPPLATVGICLELGRLDDAAGALLLFLTNFASILVIACVVFVLYGATPGRDAMRERHRFRVGFVIAVVALVLLTIPLAWHSIGTIQATIRSTTGAPVVREWLGDRDLVVTSWSIDGDHIRLVLSGPDAPPPTAPLAEALADALAASVDVEVDYIKVTRDRATGAP